MANLGFGRGSTFSSLVIHHLPNTKASLAVIFKMPQKPDTKNERAEQLVFWVFITIFGLGLLGWWVPYATHIAKLLLGATLLFLLILICISGLISNE